MHPEPGYSAADYHLPATRLMAVRQPLQAGAVGIEGLDHCPEDADFLCPAALVKAVTVTKRKVQNLRPAG